ncbi:dockerin type I domain-containing protein [Methylomagnum sp.]
MTTQRILKPATLRGALSMALSVALPLSCLATLPANASPTFGSLSNFDIINDTGGDCNGFEIELEGVRSTGVYAFEWETYGKPRLIDTTDAVSGLPVLKVRYESPYDAKTGTFPLRTVSLPSPITMLTNGHQCVNTPLVNNSSGCEHFGVGTVGNPSKVTYHWLVPDPAAPGNLKHSDSPVSIPAPLWQVLPAPDPVANPNPVVAAVIPKEAPEQEDEHKLDCSKWGPEAQWMVEYVTETEHAELENLLTDNAKVPQDKSETEVEWQLQQARPTCDEFGNPIDGAEQQNEVRNERQPADGKNSITRRYEFYKYAGAYDAENNEALPLKAPDSCKDAPYACDELGEIDLTAPNTDLGDYIGSQMAAVNVADADSDNVENVDSTGDHSKDDNCALQRNQNQRDTNGDGYGNACDPDLDDDHDVDNNDLNAMKSQFLKKNPNPNADLNGDGKVNFADLAVLKTFLGGAPGPKGGELAH